MKKNGLKWISTTMALFGLALILVLAGCEESGKGNNNNKKKDPVITGVTLSSPANPGVVFAGQGGDLTYTIKIDGTNITSVDLAGSDVIIGTLNGTTVTKKPGLSLKGTVEVGKTETIKIAVDNTLTAGTYKIAVSVKGKASNVVDLVVSEPSPVTSVVVAPAATPGEAIAGATGLLHYTVTIQGNPGVAFPIDLYDEEVVRFNMEDGEPLPSEIEIKEAGKITAFNSPANITFQLVVPAGKPGTYKMIAYIHNFPSAPFNLVVQPGPLTGEVSISYDESTGVLTAITENLDGDENNIISYQWKRSSDGENFVNIQNANSATYTITPADYDRYVTVEVSRGGYDGVKTAEGVYILDPTAPPLPGTVSITGTAKIGEKLTAVLSNFPSGAEPIFEWHRVTGSSSTIAHSGTGDEYAEYEVAEHDAGHTIKVVVSSHGYGTRIESAPTAMVPYPTVAEQFASLFAMTVKPSSYNITVHEDETLSGQTLNFGSTVINLTVRSPSDGTAKTLTMASSSAAMFMIPIYQQNVTLTLENVVLKGLDNSNHPIINNNSGVINMLEGTVITGNTNNASSSNRGGGVINRGTFNMYGGEISDNKSSYGGGVANYGTFNMYGGLITRNRATLSSGEGGGVFISDSTGKFYMYDGVISHNTADEGYGGAVSTYTGGVFAMIGGSISANNVNRSNAGALENNSGSTFLMEGGIIHGIDFEDTSLINNSYGGTGSAVLKMSGTAQLVKFNPTYTSYEVKGQLIQTGLTLHAIDGVLQRPIAAVAMVVTGITSEYTGKTGYLYARINSDWIEFADPVTVSTSTRFTFKNLQVPAEREFRLEFKDGNALKGRYEKTIDLTVGDNTVVFSTFINATPTTATSITFRGLPWTGSIDLFDFANNTNALARGTPSSGTVTFNNVNLAPGRYTLYLQQVSGSTSLLRFDCVLVIGENVIAYDDLIRISITDLPKAGIMRLYNKDTRDIVCNRFTVMSGGLRFDYAVDTNIIQPGPYNLSLEIIDSTTSDTTEVITEFSRILKKGANNISYNNLTVTSIIITEIPTELTGTLELWNKDTNVRIASAAVSDSSVTFTPVNMMTGEYKLSLKKESVADPVVNEFIWDLIGGVNTQRYIEIIDPSAKPALRLTAGEWADGNIPSSGGEQWFRFTAVNTSEHVIEFQWGTLDDLYAQMYDDTAVTTITGKPNLWSGTTTLKGNVIAGNTYYIKVEPYGSNSGAFKIRYNDPFASALTAATLTADVLTNGTMPMEGEQWYKFTATAARQYIYITFGTFIYTGIQVYADNFTTVGGSPYLGGPDTASGTSVEIIRDLTIGRTYYIRMWPYSSDYSGTYQIMFTDPFGAIPATATQLTADTWADGDMPLNGEHWYKFTATAAAQYLHFTYGTMENMNVQLFTSSFSTNGVEAALFGMNVIGRELTVGNTYYVRVTPNTDTDSDNSGTYRIKFNARPFETTIPLTAGVWADQNITMFGGTQWFNFTATAATQYVHVGFGTLTDVYIQMYDNNYISVVSQRNLSSSSDEHYISSGSLIPGNNYYVRITAGSGTSRGTYKILFNTMTVPVIPVSTALTEGVAADGNMPSSGERINWYSFTATAATQFIHVALGTFNDMYVQVYDSNFNVHQNQERISSNKTYITVPVTIGNMYYIRVTPYGSSTSNSGAYQILFNRMGLMTLPTNITPLTDDIWADGDVPTAAAENWFSLTASTPSLTIQIEYTKSSVDLRFQLFDSNYSTAAEEYNFYGSRTERVFPVKSGDTYYIRIKSWDDTPAKLGPYKIRIFNPFAGSATATQLTEDTFADGNMPVSGEQWYRFTSTVTMQRVQVEFGGLTNMYLQLYSSDGGTLGAEMTLTGSTTSIDRPLTVGDVYFIKIRPNGASQSGTYKVKFLDSGIPVTPLTEKVWADGAVLTASAVNWFSFTATANPQHLYFIPGSGADLHVYVYDKYYNLVGSNPSNPYGTSNLNITRPVTVGETYYIRIIPYNSNANYVGSYKIAFGPTLADRPAAP